MNKEFAILLFFYNQIYFCVSSPKWSVASGEKCIFTISKNWTILFEQNPSLFVTYLKDDTFEKCRSACCTHQTCNGYVFDQSNQGDGCKLLKCSKNGTDCKKALVKYDKDTPGEVGFITGLADSTTTSTTTSQSPTKSQLDERPELVVNDASQSDINEKESRLSEALSGDDEPGTTMPPTDSSLNFTESITNQFTTDSYREDIKEHTNSISLTIAFLFGLGFLLTVFYLTGRRWIEGIRDGQKKGYTRINYLLNGV